MPPIHELERRNVISGGRVKDLNEVMQLLLQLWKVSVPQRVTITEEGVLSLLGNVDNPWVVKTLRAMQEAFRAGKDCFISEDEDLIVTHVELAGQAPYYGVMVWNKDGSGPERFSQLRGVTTGLSRITLDFPISRRAERPATVEVKVGVLFTKLVGNPIAQPMASLNQAVRQLADHHAATILAVPGDQPNVQFTLTGTASCSVHGTKKDVVVCTPLPLKKRDEQGETLNRVGVRIEITGRDSGITEFDPAMILQMYKLADLLEKNLRAD